MAFKIAEAYVEIQGDKAKFSGTIRKAKMETTAFAKSAVKSLKKVTIGLGLMAAAATAASIAIGVKLTKAIIDAGKASVLTAIKYDKLRRGLTAVVGGVEEASRQWLRLKKISELPGLSFEAALQASINLQAAELSARLAERSLSAFGNALVTVGRGVPELERVNLQITQLATKTSGFGQEIRILREIVPQVGPALRKAFDGKPLEDLEITGKELVEVLVAELEKLPKAAGGISVSLENVGISFDMLKNEVGKSFLELTDSSLKRITEMLDETTRVISDSGGILGVWTKHGDVVKAIFSDIAVTAVRLTKIMFSGIADIIAAAALPAWESFWFDWKEGWRATIEDAWDRFVTSADGMPDRQKKSLERREKFQADFNKRYARHVVKQEILWTNFMDQVTLATQTTFRDAQAELKRFSDSYIETLGKIGDKPVVKPPDPEQFKAGLRSLLDDFLNIFRGKKVKPPELYLDTLEGIAEFNKRAEELYIKDLEKFRQAAGKKADADREMQEAIFEFRKQMAELALTETARWDQRRDALRIKDAARIKANVEGAVEEDRRGQEAIFAFREKIAKNIARQNKIAAEKWHREWERTANSVERTFVNMFDNILSDKTKNKWEALWDDLVNIARRKMLELVVEQTIGRLLEMLATQIASIATGGSASSGGGGGGIEPPIFVLPPAPAPSARGAPGQLNVVFPNADIEHMSRARVERAIQKQIEPAYRKLQKRGIVARQM